MCWRGKHIPESPAVVSYSWTGGSAPTLRSHLHRGLARSACDITSMFSDSEVDSSVNCSAKNSASGHHHLSFLKVTVGFSVENLSGFILLVIGGNE